MQDDLFASELRNRTGSTVFDLWQRYFGETLPDLEWVRTVHNRYKSEKSDYCVEPAHDITRNSSSQSRLKSKSEARPVFAFHIDISCRFPSISSSRKRVYDQIVSQFIVLAGSGRSPTECLFRSYPLAHYK